MNQPASLASFLKMPWLVALLLATAVGTLFSAALNFGFVNYDDNLYVTENHHVLGGLSMDGLTYAMRSVEGGAWMPLTWLSLMLDASLFGTKPWGFHLTSILLHALNTGLLYMVLWRMTGRSWAALAVAAVFGLHPLRQESVVWIAERKDVLSVFFWMLALLAYLHHAAQPSARRMAWVAFWLVLGAMAKPMVMTFPFVLLLLDFWPLKRAKYFGWKFQSYWPLIREKIPLLLVCLVLAVLTVQLQGGHGGISQEQLTWPLRLARVVENIGFYCRMFFAPSGMAIIYAEEPLKAWHVAAVGVLLAAVSLIAVWRAARWPWLVVGWFWFLITLLPVSGIVRLGEITVADRYSYLPSVGLALMLVFSLVEISSRQPRFRSLVAGALVAWIGMLALATWADLPRWRDTLTLFAGAYRNGAHFIACDQVAAELYARGDYAAALMVCERGILANPRFASLYNTRAGCRFVAGDLDAALADFDRAIAIKPAFSAPYYGRALIYVRRGDLVAARRDAEEYVRLGGTLNVAGLGIPAP